MRASAWRHALLDPHADVPPGLRTWNGSDPARRFNVYRNNVIISLIDALVDTFPVCEQLVGGEFFRHVARAFVRAHPPSSPVLARYGREFPGYLESVEEAYSVPYLADVAQLEWLYLQSHHAADCVPLDAGALQAKLAQATDLGDLRLIVQPSLRVLESAYAVASLWAAHQGALDIGKVDPYRPEVAWLVRTSHSVSVHRALEGEGPWLNALMSGASVADAIEAAHDEWPQFDPVAGLVHLVNSQAIVSIEQRRSPNKDQP